MRKILIDITNIKFTDIPVGKILKYIKFYHNKKSPHCSHNHSHMSSADFEDYPSYSEYLECNIMII